MAARVIEVGSKVRFIAGPLGTLADPRDARFEDEMVTYGDEGIYRGEHPAPNMPGWHMVEAEISGRQLFVPVHDSQFEPV